MGRRRLIPLAVALALAGCGPRAPPLDPRPAHTRHRERRKNRPRVLTHVPRRVVQGRGAVADHRTPRRDRPDPPRPRRRPAPDRHGHVRGRGSADRAVLAADKRRGVNVRVLLNHGFYGEGPSANVAAYSYLRARAVAVRWTASSFALTHQDTDHRRARIHPHLQPHPSYYTSSRDFAVIDTIPPTSTRSSRPSTPTTTISRSPHPEAST